MAEPAKLNIHPATTHVRSVHAVQKSTVQCSTVQYATLKLVVSASAALGFLEKKAIYASPRPFTATTEHACCSCSISEEGRDVITGVKGRRLKATL